MIKYLFSGIAWGCTFFVIVNLIGFLISGKAFLEPIIDDYSTQVFGAMLVGICCGSTSYVYKIERLKFKTQIIIHFIVAIPSYLFVSYKLGWMPVQNISYVVIFIIIALGIFIMIWLGFYFYNRYEAKIYNKRIKELEQK